MFDLREPCIFSLRTVMFCCILGYDIFFLVYLETLGKIKIVHLITVELTPPCRACYNMYIRCSNFAVEMTECRLEFLNIGVCAPVITIFL